MVLIFYSPKELIPFSFFRVIDFVVEFDLINITKSYRVTNGAVIGIQKIYLEKNHT